MSQFQHLRVDRDGRGVVTVTINVIGRPFNIFDDRLFSELAAIVDELEQDKSARLILFRSGKPNGFFAGADVHRIHALATSAEADNLLQSGQQLFDRIENLPVPSVAVIHGVCLGGGTEFALACTHRAAKDDAATRIGLPETQIGLIPGWGGTQRLPQVVGVAESVDMILDGRRPTVAEALKSGLVDTALSPTAFELELAKFVDECLTGRPSKKNQNAKLHDDDKTFLSQTHQRIDPQARRSPALAAALKTIETGLRDGVDVGLAAERIEFCRVLFEPASRNLLNVFIWKDLAKKRGTWVGDDVPKGPLIKKIAVLGAGTMGAGIAQTAASQGCSVKLMDVNDEFLKKGMGRIEAVTQQAVKKRVISATDAERVLASITLTTAMSSIADADLVVEAVVERLDIKLQVFAELDRVLPEHVILASNTSALPISTIAATTRRPDRIAGLHFFNPVHRMPLVEIVRCPKTSDQTIGTLVDLSKQLGKTPIVVAEGPGFLANRVLFPYLDESIRLLDEGQLVEQIDSEMRQFGLPMGPLELMDLIGLDVTADIGTTMTSLNVDEGPLIERLTAMVAQGRKGQKSGGGFYSYENGRRCGSLQTTPATGQSKLPAATELAGEAISGIQQRLILSMMNATADCVQVGIVAAPWMADLGIVLGFGFPTYRGGPMSLIEQWGRGRVKSLLSELSELCGPRYRPSEYFR
ncbi:MAG TPA: 3-hydroxyacyl-CoA dehydrogenase NAD-binding domain-containing protein [Caulifigura sp.]|nr:3-hydroxyacyl-CoA dehydrogenase NAD-binding domain-containing protein [Caulifigura sp.]